MSVLRDINYLSQMRWDIPQGRLVESAVRGDFDLAIGRIMGGGQPLVVRGFALSNVASGVSASALVLNTADSILVNVNANESGSMLWVAPDRASETLDPTVNTRITGSWAAGKTNYIGLDLTRAPAASTTDTVYFKDPDTGEETARSVPTGRLLDYQIVITTTPLAAQPNLVPVAVVTLSNSAVVTAVSDARNLAYRLGSGGDAPDPQNAYAWPQGRTETDTGLTNNLFVGGDKALTSEQDWRQAVMTRIWEIGGGEYWYSATADRNVQLVWTGAAFSNGENFEWDGTDLHWKGLRFTFDNSTVYYVDIQDQETDSAGLTDLADGECIYVNLNRASNSSDLVAQKAELITLGAGDPPGSNWIIARRIGSDVFTLGWKYPVGSWISPATTSSNGIVKLSRAASTPSTPIVISDTGGSVTAPAGANSHGLSAFGGDHATQPGLGLYAVGGDGGAAFNLFATYGAGIWASGGGGTIGSGGGKFFGGSAGGGAVNGFGVLGGGADSTASPGAGGVFFGGVMTGSTPDPTNYVNKGIGSVGMGGNSTSNAASFFGVGLVGIGGENTAYSGGATGGGSTSPLPEPGVGVVGVGGAGTYGGDGGQFFATKVGRTGMVGYGGNSSSATNAGWGGYGLGGSGSSSGVPGYGLVGTGGAATGSTAGGVGVLGSGGAASGGAGGVGVIGNGGTPSAGNNNGGAGGAFTGGAASGSGTAGYGLTATGASTQAGAYISSTSGTQATVIPATQKYGYASAKTYYHWLTANDMQSPDTFARSDLSYPAYWTNDGLGLYAEGTVHIPVNASMTSLSLCVTNDGSGEAIGFTVTLYSVNQTGIDLSTSRVYTGTVTVADNASNHSIVVALSTGLGSLPQTNSSQDSTSGSQYYILAIDATSAAAPNATYGVHGVRITYTTSNVEVSS